MLGLRRKKPSLHLLKEIQRKDSCREAQFARSICQVPVRLSWIFEKCSQICLNCW